MSDPETTWTGRIAVAWGIGGVVLLLASAVWRLTPLAVEAFEEPLGVAQWGFFVPWMIFMGYSEGYRGFQKGFSPRVVVRAWSLKSRPPLHHVLLAPAIAIGWMHGTRKRLMVARILTLGIVGLVLLVKMVPQPWRGLVDGGVVLGLGWGLAALAAFTVAALVGRMPDVPADLPGDDARPEPAGEPAALV
jgi:hypothetical protein